MATNKKATDPIAPALAVGEKLLAGFKQELCDLKNPGNTKQNIWGTLSEVKQDEILDRFGRRISHHFKMAFDAILAGGVPAVHATLAKVSFSAKAIQGNLEIPKGSEHRHALADFSGRQVLVILTEDLEEYLESMAAVKPDKDQTELPLADVDDEDPRSMAELKAAAYAGAEILNEELEAAPEDWDRAHLVDYVHWTEEKIAEAANAADAEG